MKRVTFPKKFGKVFLFFLVCGEISCKKCAKKKKMQQKNIATCIFL